MARGADVPLVEQDQGCDGVSSCSAGPHLWWPFQRSGPPALVEAAAAGPREGYPREWRVEYAP
jgi:hypothetical protein